MTSMPPPVKARTNNCRLCSGLSKEVKKEVSSRDGSSRESVYGALHLESAL